jgi:glycosyltransferase involved in cell wall biosynthesis
VTPLRPLILQPDSEPYGACRALLRAIEAMPEGAVRPVVVFPYAGRALAEYERAGCEVLVHELAVLRRSSAGLRGLVALTRDARRTGRELAALARERGCDLVHTNSMTIVSGIGAARGAGVPHVWQLREAPRERGMRVRALRTLLRRADLIVAISRAAAQVAAPLPVTIVHDGFDLPAAAREPRTGGAFTFGMVGRISPTKSQLLGIEALERIVAGGADARLVIAGAPYAGHEPYMEQLTRRVDQLGLRERVDFLGWVDDPAPVYARLDALLIATSAGEGFGGVALEAMAHGVPVVSAATGGINELVTDGVTGLVASPDDEVSIAAALERLRREPYLVRELTVNARAHAATFSTAASGVALLAAWRSVR